MSASGYGIAMTVGARLADVVLTDLPPADAAKMSPWWRAQFEAYRDRVIGVAPRTFGSIGARGLDGARAVTMLVNEFARFPRRESAVFALAPPKPLALPPRRTLRRAYGVPS